jgi:GT2 family glycosyltransferase/glycosyltransferase involved in cell wall biosynthesis
MWGTRWRQRLRLGPLYAALRAADALGARRRSADSKTSWRPGVSIVIPDRDAPDLLATALASLQRALESIDEPTQIVVVANGAAESRYTAVRASFPNIEIVHEAEPLGFGAAVLRGLEQARHDWVFLMNNDMTLDSAALTELTVKRDDRVFSLSSQIFQQSADGRREETGFTDWYIDRDGIHVFHAPIGDSAQTVSHLAGSGGATLFRTEPLVRYVRESSCYDPFYWEDIEWGVRAWRDGYQVLFCPGSHAFHRHRATTARFYSNAEIDRIVARNRVLFDARNRATSFGVDWLMERVCDLAYETQREMSRPHVAEETFARRRKARAEIPAPAPQLSAPERAAVELAPASFSYRLRPFEATAANARPRLLLVSPFAVYPPRHGGARRIAGLLAHLRNDFDVILVSDEVTLYDGRSFAGFNDLCAAHLVWRVEDERVESSVPLLERIESHCHAALRDTVQAALARYRPALVQLEYAELAGLVRLRGERERWILGLHDAVDAGDFSSAEAARRFEREVLDAFDAVTVCSEEDRTAMAPRNVTCIPNASSIALGGYRPSETAQLLFMGPFRYAPNLDGARRFVRDVFPRIKSAIREARVVVLGGDGARERVRDDPAFAQAGVEVFDHRDDVAAFLDASALTVNPQLDIRGSSIKVIESLTAGRVCVSTVDGARGFREAGLAGLVLVDDIAGMADPIVALLRDTAERHRIERPDATRLMRYQWSHSAALQRDLYTALVERRNG